MKALRLLVGVVILCSGVARAADPQPPSSIPLPAGKNAWSLIFQDEFDGSSYDASKWTPHADWTWDDGGGAFNGGRERYYASEIEVHDGVCHLVARPNPGVTTFAGSYRAGLMKTCRATPAAGEPYKFTFQYGYIEARIKIVDTSGFFGAFWVLPAKPNYVFEWEIDILEVMGNDHRTIYQTYHYNEGLVPNLSRNKYWKTNWNPGRNGTAPDTDYSTDYHTFGVDWQPDHLTYYIDGIAAGTFSNPGVNNQNIPNSPGYIIIQQMVENEWSRDPNFGNTLANTTLSETFDIDYVRVWQGVNGGLTVTASGTPSSGAGPLAVNFAATGSDADGGPLTYSWVFGDGGTAATQNPSHTYTAAGTYTATVTVADGTGDTAAADVTVTVSVPGGSGTGLLGEYFANVNFTGLTVTRVDPTVDFDWGTGAPAPALGIDTFSVRWTGQVEAPTTETYRFYTVSDDGIRLRVNGQLLVESWLDQGATEYSGTIALTAGERYDVAIEYYENIGAAVARLRWSSASLAKQVVPTSRLYASSSPNHPPVIDSAAWADLNPVTLPAGTTVHVVASDPDGDPLTYAWTQESGVGTVTFAAPAAADGGVTFSAPGTCVLRVTVSDDQGGSVTSDVTVTVNAGSGGDARADVNADGVVNALDLQIIIANFGRTVGSPGCDARADANGDSVVNALDLQITIANFGKTVGNSLVGWELNSTNTGLAGVGIDKNDLPLYTGTDTPLHGTVIREKKIPTCLVLVNGNITIERCWIQPASTRNQGSLIFTYDPGMWIASQYSSSIVDCDIDGTAITDTRVYADAAIRGHATVLRCNIFGMGSGIAIGASPQPPAGFDILVEGNYVHDLRGGMFGSPPQQSHNESATIRGYNGTNMIWRNNRLVSKTGLSGGQDSAALFIAAQNAYLNHVRLEGNLMETIGWCIAVEPAPYGYGDDMRAVNNRFVPLGYGAGYVAGGPGWAQWTDNYYNNPANPDNKGAAAAEP